MSSVVKPATIDELMEKASTALAATRYFEAERLCVKAMSMARQLADFDRMARIVLPLQEARRQRYQQALDTGEVVCVEEVPAGEEEFDAGCYLLAPPAVGADARRLRLSALHREVPVAVLCREPVTMLGLWPVVAIGPSGSLRAKIDPPDDPEAPDLAWLAHGIKALGDSTIDNLDPELEPIKRVDALLERLDAVPEHERLHQALHDACQAAQREASAESAAPSRSRSRVKT